MTPAEMVAKTNEIRRLFEIIGYRVDSEVTYICLESGKWRVTPGTATSYEGIGNDPELAADVVITKLRAHALASLESTRKRAADMAKALGVETLEDVAARKPDPPDPDGPPDSRYQRGPAPSSRVCEPYGHGLDID